MLPKIKNRIIAISGHKGAGKDTTADFLVKHYNYSKISLASPLKDMVARQYGIHRSLMDHRTLKDEPLLHMPAIPSDPYTEMLHHLLREELKSGYWTPRALLILEGSSKRAVNSNYWVRQVIEEVKKHPDRKYVISDLRYTSEADTFKMLIPREEIYLLRVDRAGLDPGTQDPSERDLDLYSFDGKVFNIAGTEQEYLNTLEVYFSYLLGRKMVK